MVKQVIHISLLIGLIANNYQLVFTKKALNITAFSTDKLNNIYIFDDNVLKKYSIDGNTIAEYQNNSINSNISIHTDNVFKTILFDETNQSITILDEQLAFLQMFKIFDLWNKYEFDRICVDKTLEYMYGYSKVFKQIVKVNMNSKKYFIYDVSYLKSSILMLYISKGKLYIKTEDKLIFELNTFTKELQQFPFTEVKCLNIAENYIYILNQFHKIERYNLKTFEKDIISLQPSIENIGFKINQGYLYLFNQNEFSVYKKK